VLTAPANVSTTPWKPEQILRHFLRIGEHSGLYQRSAEQSAQRAGQPPNADQVAVSPYCCQALCLISTVYNASRRIKTVSLDVHKSKRNPSQHAPAPVTTEARTRLTVTSHDSVVNVHDSNLITGQQKEAIRSLCERKGLNAEAEANEVCKVPLSKLSNEEARNLIRHLSTATPKKQTSAAA
jgi:hypothetical protein